MASEPTLRPATAEDREQLLALYAESRSAELEGFDEQVAAAFVAQQFAAQDHAYRQYEGLSYDVVLVDGAIAGRLIVARWEHELRIVDILVASAYRSRGIGTALLGELLDEAGRRGVPASIHVEQFNPAQRLYQRLGFTLAEALPGGVYLRLERAPDQPKIAS